MNSVLSGEPARELAQVESGRLPARYGYPMQEVMWERLKPLLTEGMAILDVGAGRNPTLGPDDRPAGCHYTGIDVSAQELAAATPGAYTDSLVADIADSISAERSYDVAISWQVLEHVKPLERALENLRGVLRPGGTLLAQLSGSRAFFAAVGRVLPHRVRVAAMSRLLGERGEEKFPTRFDRCNADALKRMLAPWASAEITPYYRGATYLGFSRPLQRAYLGYENLLERRDSENFATHYLIEARR